jgi:hypothetical protein
MCRDKADLQIRLARDAIQSFPLHKIMTGIILGVLLSLLLAAGAPLLTPLGYLVFAIFFSIPVAYLLIEIPSRWSLKKWIKREWFKPYGRYMTYAGTHFGFSSAAYLDRFREANSGSHTKGSKEIFWRSSIRSYQLGDLNNSPYFDVRDGRPMLVSYNKDIIRVFAITTAVVLSLSFTMFIVSNINPSLFPIIASLPVLLAIFVVLANLREGYRQSKEDTPSTRKPKTKRSKPEYIPCLYCGYEKNSPATDTCSKCKKPLKGDRWKVCEKCGYYFNEPDSTHCICGELL